MPIPDDFQQLFQQERVANEQFLAGDAGPAKMQWSHANDVTICGGFGAYEKGWEQVGPRLDWAAAAYREGHSTEEGQGHFSAIPSIFDHTALDPSTIASYYHLALRGFSNQHKLPCKL